MEEKNWMEQFIQEKQMQEVMQTNRYTKKFGLELDREDAELLVQERKNSLRERQRVEFGEGILKKLVFHFCDSPFITQENYADTLMRLQDIFYLYKNESLDELTDDELLEYMKEKFDGICAGDIDYLEGTVLDTSAREVRTGTKKYIGKYREDEA